MHILHIIAPGEVGGLERVVHALTGGLVRRGHRVTVFAILDEVDPDHPALLPLRESGVEVIAHPFPGRQYLRERRAVVDLVRRVAPDVVHTHGYRADVVSGTAVRAAGFPVVTTVHGFTGGGWKNRLYERMQERAFRRFDAVVAVSAPLVQRLTAAGVPQTRIRLLRNGWGRTSSPLPRDEARALLGVSRDDFHVGWVGRLSAEKGPDLLLAAIPELDREVLTVSFVGDGREAVRLRQQAAERGVADIVRWHGSLPDAGRLFPAFDVFVLSSRTEGTPIALLEAMAAAVPIVATRVGGVPDVVSDAEAILVDPGEPTALAAAIDGVRRDPAGARSRVERAAERLAQEFDRDSWLDGYEAIYRSVAPRAAGPRATKELV